MMPPCLTYLHLFGCAGGSTCCYGAQCSHPGPKDSLSLRRDGQLVAIGIATERSAATPARRKIGSHRVISLASRSKTCTPSRRRDSHSAAPRSLPSVCVSIGTERECQQIASSCTTAMHAADALDGLGGEDARLQPETAEAREGDERSEEEPD